MMIKYKKKCSFVFDRLLLKVYFSSSVCESKEEQMSSIQ
jgi:hypothetical protein